MKKELIYLDSCLPDYFQGTNMETIIAFHWKGQKTKDVIDNLIVNTLNECHDGAVFEAIENFKIENAEHLEKVFLNEKFITFDDDGSTDIIHYFGILESHS